MDSYKVIEEKLDGLVPFRGNSMSGNWYNGRFIVWSYQTAIGYSDVTGFGISEDKYSVTTSRHQNLLRKVWGPKAKENN